MAEPDAADSVLELAQLPGSVIMSGVSGQLIGQTDRMTDRSPQDHGKSVISPAPKIL